MHRGLAAAAFAVGIFTAGAVGAAVQDPQPEGDPAAFCAIRISSASNADELSAELDVADDALPGAIADAGTVYLAGFRSIVETATLDAATDDDFVTAAEEVDTYCDEQGLRVPVPRALNTAVNAQVTDSVSQVNTKVLGDAPAIAMGNLFQATSQALALSAYNAVASQHTGMTPIQHSSVGLLYSIDTASEGEGVRYLLEGR